MNKRSDLWHSIWQKKYQAFQTHNDLHVAAGYDMLSYSQWQALTGYFINQLALDENSRVLEVGCGCGAFLNELVSKVGTIAGVDYSADAIARLKAELTGEFHTCDAANLPFAEQSFDAVLSFGVFFYFEDLEYARCALDEMRRVLSAGGEIFIGEVSDAAKKGIADRIRGIDTEQRNSRKVSKVDADHLYYDKSFFIDYAEQHGMQCQIIDQDVPQLSFYPNAAYRFAAILRFDSANSSPRS